MKLGVPHILYRSVSISDPVVIPLKRSLLTCRKVPSMKVFARPKSAILTTSGVVDEISTFYTILSSGL
jgi:hypothetical protein